MNDPNQLPPSGRHAQFYEQREAWHSPNPMESPAVLLAPWQLQVLWQARDALKRSEHALAVLLSQVAAELHTKAALIDVLSRRMEAPLAESVVRQLRGSCLSDRDRSIRKFWGELTGDYPGGNGDPVKAIKPSEWWKAWNAARDLRDEIVHRAPTVGQTEAEAAYQAAEKYIAHMRRVAEQKPQAAP